jgi:hypothetical protein
MWIAAARHNRRFRAVSTLGNDLAMGRIKPSAVDALCAETDQFGARRWPSCIVLGLPKKRP